MRFRQAASVFIGVVALIVRASGGDEVPPGSEAKTLTVAVVSSHSVFCDPDANLEHFEALINEAAEKGARLVCFPELALMAYAQEVKIPETSQCVGRGRWNTKLAARTNDETRFSTVADPDCAGFGRRDSR